MLYVSNLDKDRVITCFDLNCEVQHLMVQNILSCSELQANLVGWYPSNCLSWILDGASLDADGDLSASTVIDTSTTSESEEEHYYDNLIDNIGVHNEGNDMNVVDTASSVDSDGFDSGREIGAMNLTQEMHRKSKGAYTDKVVFFTGCHH